MKPVAIFQHDMTQRPGYLLDFLERHDIPRRIFCPDFGEDVPDHANDFSGLIFLGSPRSVNDSLDWIDKEMELVRRAMAADKPVLGHCFGGQLMAKTLGAKVMRNPSPQIGWGPVLVTKFDEAREWFGERLVKRLYHRNGRLALLAEHPGYPAVEANEGVEFLIWGVVVGKFKRFGC